MTEKDIKRQFAALAYARLCDAESALQKLKNMRAQLIHDIDGQEHLVKTLKTKVEQAQNDVERT